MGNYTFTAKNVDYAIYVEIKGKMTLLDALNLKSTLPNLIIEGLPIHLDLTAISQIDINGLNALLTTKLKCDELDSPLYIKTGKENPLFELLDETKFKNQFSFRNTLIPAC